MAIVPVASHRCPKCYGTLLYLTTDESNGCPVFYCGSCGEMHVTFECCHKPLPMCRPEWKLQTASEFNYREPDDPPGAHVTFEEWRRRWRERMKRKYDWGEGDVTE